MCKLEWKLDDKDVREVKSFFMDHYGLLIDRHRWAKAILGPEFSIQNLGGLLKIPTKS
jgi:hypothetical protein